MPVFLLQTTMNKPTPEVLQAISDMRDTTRFQSFLDWIRANHAIASANLENFEGADLHRTQGDARTLRSILTYAESESGHPARQGQGRAR